MNLSSGITHSLLIYLNPLSNFHNFDTINNCLTLESSRIHGFYYNKNIFISLYFFFYELLDGASFSCALNAAPHQGYTGSPSFFSTHFFSVAVTVWIPQLYILLKYTKSPVDSFNKSYQELLCIYGGWREVKMKKI